MGISSSVILIRAIGSELAGRLIKKLSIIFTVALILDALLGLYLTTFSDWWWILVIASIILLIMLILGVIVISLALTVVKPHLTSDVSRDVASFVDKLEASLDTISTPLPLVAIYIIKDTIWPKQPSYLEQLINQANDLQRDFNKLTTIVKV